jgi:predicted RNA-binding protein with PIN domain
MRWLVDGMNVIGSRPTGWWHDRTGAMRELVAQLRGFAEATGEPVAVVFDGRPRELGEDPGPVVVAFAPGGRNAADDEIARLVAQDERPAELRVVTSDADLSTRVRARGAEVVGAGGFRRRLDDEIGGGSDDQAPGGL